jgi:uncharacterized protein
MEENGEGAMEAGELKDEFRFSPRANRAHEINWLPWGAQAFRKAESEGKLLLLSISAVWCHWCHVMDETSYSDHAVIDLINNRYIPVRVDSDRNPDINRRYNQGGWPTTAFLDPKGRLLAGATYIPPETMRAALERISQLYTDQEVEIAEQDIESILPADKTPDLDLRSVEEIGAQLLRAWDRVHGGLGREPKFPQVEGLDLAFELYADEGNAEYLVFARSTLEAMIRGNLLDKVEGGFFRYSTTRDWSIPHYEKMLSDNTGLVTLLLKAYSLTGADIFRRTAGETADYIQRTLSDGASRLFGSQDADEEYYLLGADGREQLTPPPVDETVYTDLAARAAVSLLAEGTALGRPDHVSLALSALEFLWSELYRPGDGMAHYWGGEPRRWGMLGDGAETAGAFLAAFGYTGEGRYLERAETLLREMVYANWDGERSLFLDIAAGHLLPGLRPEVADPGSQSRAAEAMLHYWAFSGEEEWRSRAGEVLAATSGMAAAYGVLAAAFASAVNLYLRGPLMVKISGNPAGNARPFLKAALLTPRPRTLPMVSQKMGRILEEAGAEVCTAESCQFQTREPEALSRHLGVREEISKVVNEDEGNLS